MEKININVAKGHTTISQVKAPNISTKPKITSTILDQMQMNFNNVHNSFMSNSQNLTFGVDTLNFKPQQDVEQNVVSSQSFNNNQNFGGQNSFFNGGINVNTLTTLLPLLKNMNTKSSNKLDISSILEMLPKSQTENSPILKLLPLIQSLSTKKEEKNINSLKRVDDDE